MGNKSKMKKTAPGEVGAVLERMMNSNCTDTKFCGPDYADDYTPLPPKEIALVAKRELELCLARTERATAKRKMELSEGHSGFGDNSVK